MPLSSSKMHHCSLIFLLFLFPGTLSVSPKTFSSCLPPSVPHYFPRSPQFRNITSVSYINNRFTPLIATVPRSEVHVSMIVRCARKAGLRVCPRSGGHSTIGSSLCNGVLIDMRNLRQVNLIGNGIAEIGGGAVIGEVLWKLWNSGRRWFSSGVCTGVGVGGFVFGGGYGPYSGKLGLACDSLVEVRMVDRFGNVIVTSKTRKADLFWGLCGAGGGQFGVVTSFKLKTVTSAEFDRSVAFRMEWPWQKGGELLQKWSEYGEEGGRVFARTAVHLERGVSMYGACYDVWGVEQCMGLLRKAKFFSVPGRKIWFMKKMENAMMLHAFFGPEGGWSWVVPKNVRRGILGQRFVAGGGANQFKYQSGFLRKGSTTVPFWQRYVQLCRKPDTTSFPWVLCELTLFNNALNWNRDNAFAFREANIITHYIIGGGTKQDKESAYWRMRNHFGTKKFGVYVNYPELELGKTYPRMYWGKSLEKLMVIKKFYDPQLFFRNSQPIPVR